MHHIYTTKAFVVSSAPYGEAGKLIFLFTEDFGMIAALAQGVRLNQSKLRYHLQNFNFAQVSIVRGKEVWRITGALELDHKKVERVHLKILKLLRRLLQGEEKNQRLFQIIESLYKTDIKENDDESLECLIVLRILYELGYVQATDKISDLIQDNSINQKHILYIDENKKEIIKIINNALSESQL